MQEVDRAVGRVGRMERLGLERADCHAHDPGLRAEDDGHVTLVVAQGDVPTNKHIMGGMRMGDDPTTSVCDEFGRVRSLDNLFVTDAGVFVNAGAGNPTLTLMAVALRSARAIVNVTVRARPVNRLPATGVDLVSAAAVGAAAVAAGAALRRASDVRRTT